LAFFVAVFLLSGFTKPSPAPQIYFTIYCEDQRIDVTDELLRGGWWNYQSQKNFNGGKSLYERAQKATSVKKDFPEIWRLVLKLQRDIEIKPDDGDILFTPQPRGMRVESLPPRFQVIGRRSGRDLDEDKLCRDILTALKSGEHQNIVAAVKQTHPRDDDAILAGITLRSGYTTYFEENPAREHNIALSLAAFNGLVVRNGERVSFNKVVGPRTRARGYEEAKIIVCGEFVPGVGGGVCQSSTTLFNALLMAGLRIDESHNHSLAISYVPIGRDAMVSSVADLEFTNNTGGTVYFETGIIEKSCFVRIYGKRTPIKYKPRVTCEEAELNEGEIDPARTSLTYIEAYNGDRLVHSKLVRKSKYRARKADAD